MTLILEEYSLNWALTYALEFGDTTIFPRCFEYKAIQNDWESIRDWIRSKDILQWSISPTRTTLAPKHPLSFRRVTQLDPIDFLVFNALIREIGKRLEAARVSVEENVVHSNRFKPDSKGQMFDERVNFGSFQLRSRQLCDTDRYSHVLITDISDYFPRLYHHRIENALEGILGEGHQHCVAIMSLLRQWSDGTSYGIPVGPQICHLLADITITDIDLSLLSEGVQYVRYVDDFRIFCTSEREAYIALNLLASRLDSIHGLTLQQTKTSIVPVDRFLSKQAVDPKDTEQSRLNERIREVLESIGIESLYEARNRTLTAGQVAELEKLNLSELLTACIDGSDFDPGWAAFILRRLADVSDDSALTTVIENLETLYSILKPVVAYLHSLLIRGMSDATSKTLFTRMIEVLIGEGKVGASSYNRMLITSLFRNSGLIVDQKQLVELFNRFEDTSVRREIVLAMGRHGMDFWLRGKRESLGELSPWLRRAFLAALSCLKKDEFKYWSQMMKQHVTPLEKAVLKWSEVVPWRANSDD